MPKFNKWTTLKKIIEEEVKVAEKQLSNAAERQDFVECLDMKYCMMTYEFILNELFPDIEKAAKNKTYKPNWFKRGKNT